MMTLSKSLIRYTHDQPCFDCRWSEIDPFDWGLRCCCDDSEYCTEYCPDRACEHYWKEDPHEKDKA